MWISPRGYIIHVKTIQKHCAKLWLILCKTCGQNVQNYLNYKSYQQFANWLWIKCGQIVEKMLISPRGYIKAVILLWITFKTLQFL
jgi:hypothetical protein